MRKAVKDTDRAKVAAEVATRMQATNDDVVCGVVELRSELFQVLGNYDSREAEWSSVLSSAKTLLAGGEDDLLRLRFELRDKVTEEEWTTLFAGLRKDRARMGW